MIRTLLIAASLLAAPGLRRRASHAEPCRPPNACADAEHRQFDFWVGRWVVTPTGKDKVVAESLIEKVYGCGIRENWMPKVPNGDGGSLSIYVPAQKALAADLDRCPAAPMSDYKGGWDGHAMVLTGDWPGPDGKPEPGSCLVRGRRLVRGGPERRGGSRARRPRTTSSLRRDHGWPGQARP